MGRRERLPIGISLYVQIKLGIQAIEAVEARRRTKSIALRRVRQSSTSFRCLAVADWT